VIASPNGGLRRTSDIVVIGAGAVGAACAYFLARAGLRVQVVERGQVASGTSSACEGNLLVSDKEVGPELDLALYSHTVWQQDLAEHGPLWEFESKGGFVVAATADGADALRTLGRKQRTAGVEVVDVPATAIRDHEPYLRDGLAATAYYQDAGRPCCSPHTCCAWPGI
jgi:glycine/D-amino acid oxidase-like deaminating enzyme